MHFYVIDDGEQEYRHFRSPSSTNSLEVIYLFFIKILKMTFHSQLFIQMRAVIYQNMQNSDLFIPYLHSDQSEQLIGKII